MENKKTSIVHLEDKGSRYNPIPEEAKEPFKILAKGNLSRKYNVVVRSDT